MNKITRRIQNIKIDFQRWIFNMRYKSGSRRDLEAQLKAIQKATKLQKKRGIRLWVVRIFPGKYGIYPKGEVKSVLKRIGLTGRINMFQQDDFIVHITK